MNSYFLALFIHMLALGLAAGTTAIVKFSLGRRNTARTVGEMLEWHALLMKAAVFFPISLAVFVLSGGYMVRVAHMPWSTPYVVAGLIAVVILFIGGGVMGGTGRRFKERLEALAATGADQAAPVPEPAFLSTLSYANVGLVVGVVFDMATRQTSMPTALAALAIGFVGGALLGARTNAPATAGMAARATEGQLT